jgi:hypothetical protein
MLEPSAAGAETFDAQYPLLDRTRRIKTEFGSLVSSMVPGTGIEPVRPSRDPEF